MTKDSERVQRSELGEKHGVSNIEDVHRELRSRLDDLEAATEPQEMLAVLIGLPRTLSEHFQDEEGPEGLYANLLSMCPPLAAQLDSLRSEHREILEILDGLKQDLRRQCEAGETSERFAAQKSQADNLLEMLRRHEADESRLIADAYYSEEGGHG